MLTSTNDDLNLDLDLDLLDVIGQITSSGHDGDLRFDVGMTFDCRKRSRNSKVDTLVDLASSINQLTKRAKPIYLIDGMLTEEAQLTRSLAYLKQSIEAVLEVVEHQSLLLLFWNDGLHRLLLELFAKRSVYSAQTNQRVEEVFSLAFSLYRNKVLCSEIFVDRINFFLNSIAAYPLLIKAGFHQELSTWLHDPELQKIAVIGLSRLSYIPEAKKLVLSLKDELADVALPFLLAELPKIGTKMAYPLLPHEFQSRDTEISEHTNSYLWVLCILAYKCPNFCFQMTAAGVQEILPDFCHFFNRNTQSLARKIRGKLIRHQIGKIPTQSVIIEQFLIYMDGVRLVPLTETEKQMLKKGLCHGFAVAFGYMEASEKLDWWVDVLRNIQNWDRSPATLTPELSLQFERAASYILYAHLGLNGYVSRFRLFEPDTDYFFSERPFRKYAAGAGSLSDDQLKNLMVLLSDPAFSEETFILLHTIDHHICLFNRDGDLFLYNSNEPKIQSDFLLQRIFYLPMGIEILSTPFAAGSKKDKAIQSINLFFQDALYSTDFSILKNSGAHMIAQYVPDWFARLYSVHAENERFYAHLALSLAVQNGEGWTLLHILGRQTPKIFSLFLQIVMSRSESEFSREFNQALRLKNQRGVYALDFLEKHASEEWAEWNRCSDIDPLLRKTKQFRAERLARYDFHPTLGAVFIEQNLPFAMQKLLENRLSLVPQAKLIKQVLLYFVVQNRSCFDKDQLAKIQRGLCQGFSFVFCYMLFTQKVTWWLAALDAIKEWDGTKEQLMEQKVLPQADPVRPIRTLEALFERVFNFVFYYQCIDENIIWFDLCKNPEKMFFAEQNLIWRGIWSGYFPELVWEEVYQIFKKLPAEAAVLLHSENHLMVLFAYAEELYLYDPNKERLFPAQKLFHYIREEALAFHLITLPSCDPKVQIDELQALYQRQCADGVIFGSKGLHKMVQYGDRAGYDFFQKALAGDFQSQSIIISYLDQLTDTQFSLFFHVCEQPKLLSQVLDWATREPKIYAKIKLALNIQQDSGIYHPLIRCPPDKIGVLFEWARTDAEMETILVQSLSFQNQIDKYTFLHCLAYKDKAALELVLLWARKDTIRPHMSHALSLKNRNLRTVSDLVGDDPRLQPLLAFFSVAPSAPEASGSHPFMQAHANPAVKSNLLPAQTLASRFRA